MALRCPQLDAQAKIATLFPHVVEETLQKWFS